MNLASKGALHRKEILTVQVDRMLKSPKSISLAESFGVQWLGIANLDELIKEPISHHSLRHQPVLFLNHLFTKNRPVLELINSKTTFVNQGVSGFYGQDRGRMTRFSKPKGIERTKTPFEEFTIEKATWRGGIITMPGILTMNRGPIQRGTWFLQESLVRLGEPPADIPPIKPSPRDKTSPSGKDLKDIVTIQVVHGVMKKLTFWDLLWITMTLRGNSSKTKTTSQTHQGNFQPAKNLKTIPS